MHSACTQHALSMALGRKPLCSERSCEYLVHDHVRDPAEVGISVQSTQQHPRRAEEETRGGRALRLEADLIAHLPNMDIIQRNQAQSGAIKGHPTQSQYRLAEWLAIRRNQTQSRAIRRNLSTVWPSGSHRSAATRVATPIALKRRGWVQMIETAPARPDSMASSRMN